jgi:hypothetical protein
MDKYYTYIGDSNHIAKYFAQVDLDLPEWQSYMGWNASIIPLESVLLEDTLAKVNNILPIKGAAVLKMEPHTCYKWHVDTGRGCSINMLLRHTDSLCLFGKEINTQNLDITKLNYDYNKFYLFNTREPHTVINFDGMRYLFSVQFEDFVDYNTAKSVLVSNSYESNIYSRRI